MKIKKHLMALSILRTYFVAISQNQGIHSINYAGVMGANINPANFMDGRFKVDINLGNFNLKN